MKKYTHKTIEGALNSAAQDLGCFVVDLKYEVLQNPRQGFFGIGSRQAVILACNEGQKLNSENIAFTNEDLDILSVDPFSKDMEINVLEIRDEITEMMGFLPYDIDKIEVSFSQNTLYVNLDGPDAPLLIGEKGYRYRALSYLLFNWIYPKYGCNLRLEVAQFLRIQEEIIFKYLDEIDHEIVQNKTTTTKNLNKIMQIIVLGHLRTKYPGSYIYIKKDCQNNDEAPIVITHLK